MKNQSIFKKFNNGIVFIHHYFPFFNPVAFYILFLYLAPAFAAVHLMGAKLVFLVLSFGFVFTVKTDEGYFKNQRKSVLFTLVILPFILYFLLQYSGLTVFVKIADFLALLLMAAFCFSQAFYGGCVLDVFENRLFKKYQSSLIAPIYLYAGHLMKPKALRVIYLCLGTLFVLGIFQYLGLNISPF